MTKVPVQAIRPVIVRRKGIESVIGIGPEEVDELERDGKFPARVELTPGGRRRGWRYADLEEWAAERPQVKVGG